MQSSLQRLSTSGLFADEFKHEQKSVRMLSTGSHFDKARGLSGKTPLEAYKSWIAENKLREDDSQKEAIVQFNRLLIELKQASANPKFARKTSYPTGFRPEMSSLFSMFRKGGASAQAVHSSDNVNHSAEGHVKGLYVYALSLSHTHTPLPPLLPSSLFLRHSLSTLRVLTLLYAQVWRCWHGQDHAYGHVL